MKVLLINNSTQRLKQVQELLREHDTTTVNYKEIKKLKLDNFDLIVLSGSNMNSAFKNEVYQEELELIKNASQPIFGICLGFQLIALAYSPIIFTEHKPRKFGIATLTFKDKEITVFTSHRWAVPQVQVPLVEISRSQDGVEILKHESKTIWGVQFHPEADVEYGTNGKIVFDAFLAEVNSRRNI